MEVHTHKNLYLCTSKQLNYRSVIKNEKSVSFAAGSSWVAVVCCGEVSGIAISVVESW